MVKSIYLQDGEEIFVDDEDYEKVNQYLWYKDFVGNTRYICTTKSRGEVLSLISLILQDGFQIKKNNDFTKQNLTIFGSKGKWARAARNKSSKYKGVSFNKNEQKWTSSIFVNGKKKHLGTFTREDEAANAYNKAVLEYWDGNGYINHIGSENSAPTRNYNTNKNFQNQRNKTGYRGVSKNKNGYISVKFVTNKCVYFGRSNSKEKCALIYNKCVIYLYGADAVLNEVPINDELKEFIDNWEIPEKVKALKEGATSE